VAVVEDAAVQKRIDMQLYRFRQRGHFEAASTDPTGQPSAAQPVEKQPSCPAWQGISNSGDSSNTDQHLLLEGPETAVAKCFQRYLTSQLTGRADRGLTSLKKH
jgi:hypothetical protein